MLLKERKSNIDLEKYLNKLEIEAGDDLMILLEHGPDCFETYELELLLDRVLKQSKQLLSMRRMTITVLVVALFSVLLSVYAFLNEQIIFGYLFLGFLPIYMGLTGFMYFRFHKNNLTINKTPYLKNLLEKEILQRQNKTLF